MNRKKTRFAVAVIFSLVLLMLVVPTIAFAQNDPSVDPTATEPVPTATASATPTNTPVPTDPPTNTPTSTPTVSGPDPVVTPVPVPEPVTVVLFGTGLAALSAAVASRRRRDDSK